MVLQNDIDLLNPPAELEKRKHKLKRLVQSPNSFFMHYCVQSLADRCCMRKLPDSSVPAYRRKGKAHGRMLFQEEVRLI
uniref:40S ribosomal protein S27 n=1 Tax=Brassica oleracea var. oleracea TaxID=109376 RepID=A0A0D3DUR1_BRAOL